MYNKKYIFKYSKIYKVQNSFKTKMTQKYVSEYIKLAKLLLKGFVLEKTVRKFGTTSGVIFVPKRWVGKVFKVILIPKEDTDELLI